MCGFTGVISKNNIDTSALKKSDKFLSCRGPDEHRWIENSLDSNINSFFSFHRLSILDLSNAASQPMGSNFFNTEIVFNGEIYNHPQLRKEMESNNVQFKTSHSDSETLLNGLSVYGLEFINKIEGQFAAAFVNKDKQTITLFRDRLGQKPLYYSLSKNELIFSSDFRSVLVNKKSFNLNEDQIINFLELGVVPSPYTMDKNIFKVKPGELIELSLKSLEIIRKVNYWDLKNFISDEKFENSKFIDLFHKSVKKRMLSDVPIATLLSGGIDSTSIVKSLFDSGYNNINSFSIKNKNKKYDESSWSDEVSKKYETNHTVETIDGNDLKLNPKEVILSFDEPYSDPSIFPSFLIYKIIAKNYKVAISGDGGDELLGGYEKISFSIHKGFLNKSLITLIKNIIPDYLGTGGSLSKFGISKEDSFVDLTTDRALINLLDLKPKISYKDTFLEGDLQNFKKFILSDYKFFLSELMLLKVDRTSMANSLEVRSPFLDHKLIEYVLSTDMSFYDPVNTKLPLKNFLKEDFNNNFLNRKKMGFVFDLENWVFNPDNFIKEELLSFNMYKFKNIDKLFKFRTRVNAIRILKIYTLITFLKEYQNLVR